MQIFIDSITNLIQGIASGNFKDLMVGAIVIFFVYRGVIKIPGINFGKKNRRNQDVNYIRKSEVVKLIFEITDIISDVMNEKIYLYVEINNIKTNLTIKNQILSAKKKLNITLKNILPDDKHIYVVKIIINELLEEYEVEFTSDTFMDKFKKDFTWSISQRVYSNKEFVASIMKRIPDEVCSKEEKEKLTLQIAPEFDRMIMDIYHDALMIRDKMDSRIKIKKEEIENIKIKKKKLITDLLRRRLGEEIQL